MIDDPIPSFEITLEWGSDGNQLPSKGERFFIINRSYCHQRDFDSLSSNLFGNNKGKELKEEATGFQPKS